MTSSAKTAARAPAARRVGLLLALSLALPGCQSTREFFGFGAANSGPTLGTPGFVRGFLGGVAAEDPAAALTASNEALASVTVAELGSRRATRPTAAAARRPRSWRRAR